jgi:hypothetical protein
MLTSRRVRPGPTFSGLAAIVINTVLFTTIIIRLSLPDADEHHMLDASKLFIEGVLNYLSVQTAIDHHAPARFGL